MNWLLQFWRRLTTSTEVALLRTENAILKETNLALEDDNETLKRELRGAVNSMLSQAGAIPLPPAEEVKVSKGRMRHLTHQQRQRIYALETLPKPKEQVDDRRTG